MQAREKNHRGRRRGKIQRCSAASHQLRQFPLNNANHRLPGRQRADHFLPERLFPNGGDQLLHDWKRDVGFEKCEAYLAQCVLDVRFGEPRFTAQLLDDAAEPLSQIFKHGNVLIGRASELTRGTVGVNCTGKSSKAA